MVFRPVRFVPERPGTAGVASPRQPPETMTDLLLVSLAVLTVGLIAAVAWGRRQRAALRAIRHHAEQGRSDGERLVTDARDAHAALRADYQLLELNRPPKRSANSPR